MCNILLNSLLEMLISLFFIVSREEFFYCVILEENLNHHLSCSCLVMLRKKTHHIYKETGQIRRLSY